jgi:hypothetical protein
MLNGNEDFALAQVLPSGSLASCTGFPCNNWSTGRAYVDWGGIDSAYAVDVRNDGQVVAAGFAGGQFSWAQFNPTTAASPLKGVTDFVNFSSITAVQFAGPNKLIAAGFQSYNNDLNFALARFETRNFTPRFADVPNHYWAWQGPNLYCPNDEVTRAQMAVFLLRVKYGSNYVPPAATGIFADVPDDFFRPWIEQLAREGITSGCGPNVYCPSSAVTRAQMAVFLARTLNLPLP